MASPLESGLTVPTHAYVTAFLDLDFALAAAQRAECSEARGGWTCELRVEERRRAYMLIITRWW